MYPYSIPGTASLVNVTLNICVIKWHQIRHHQICFWKLKMHQNPFPPAEGVHDDPPDLLVGWGVGYIPLHSPPPRAAFRPPQQKFLATAVYRYVYKCMCMKGLAALRLALVEEAIFSGHFSHVTRCPTLAGVALMSSVMTLRRQGHVVLQWPDFIAAAASHDPQLLGNDGVVDAETALLHTVVRTTTKLPLNPHHNYNKTSASPATLAQVLQPSWTCV